jgi:hypothetical protein
MPSSNWYPGKAPIAKIKLNPLPEKKHINSIGACPICGDKGLNNRPPGWQGNDTWKWTPCAAGPPWHDAKQ